MTHSDLYRSYESYDTTSSTYDETRVVPALDLLLGLLESGPGPLAEQRVLDAGCGTGTHVAALLSEVGQIVGLEYSEGMLAKARQKLGDAPRVQLDRGSVFEMPYADASFDAVLFNQVLHHLDTPDSLPAFSGTRRALSEATRVLRPDGLLIINTTSTKQLADGFWWSALIPEGWADSARRFISVPELERVMSEELGLEEVGTSVSLDAVLQGEAYLDPTGPLSVQWRNGDSAWSLAAGDELAAAIARVQAMVADGTMAEFVAARDERRGPVGQTTYVYGRRVIATSRTAVGA